MGTKPATPSKHGDKLPAISVRQPFAELIMLGLKDWEYRTWNTHYRGPLLIHASNTMNNELKYEAAYGVGCSYETLSRLDRGGYVGIVTIKDVFVYMEADEDLDLPKEFAFVLGDVKRFDRLIPGKGAANLFYPSDEDWKKINASL